MTKYSMYKYKVVLETTGRWFADERFQPVSYPASNEDLEVWKETITLFLLNTLDTLGPHLVDDRDLKSWCCSFSTLGCFDIFLADLKSIDKLVLHHLQCDYDTFLAKVKDDLKSRCLVARQYLGRLKWFLSLVASNDSRSIAGMHQLCSFAERVTVKGYPGAEERAVEKWKAGYEYISSFTSEASCGMKESVFSKFNKYNFWELFSPHHSSGSVLEKETDIHGRKRRLTRLEKYLYTNGRLTRYFLRNAGIPPLPAPFVTEPPKDYTCQMYVPKGVDDRRIVEPECCERVFVQHGVAEAINHVLEEEYGNHYYRHDSTKNGELALIGSKLGNYDTIDISSASDSNRWMLVKSLFAYCDSSWVDSIRIARSRLSKLPDGTLLPKVAVGSMGSPMTFPLETLVFCELIEEAARRRGVNPRTLHYLVYGDDMVVPHFLLTTVLSVLEEYGFQTNMKKTFVGEELFRESCGTDAYLGIDITPVRISRFWSPLDVSDPQSVASNVDLANRSFGVLPLTRHYLITRLLEKLSLPFSDDRTGIVLKGSNPTNRQLRFGRYDENLQYETVKIHALSAKRSFNGIIPDELAYWEWLQCTERRTCPPSPTVEQDPMEELALGHRSYFSSVSLRSIWTQDIFT